jgi:site-specific DNA-methyltransferase (adenine-specific)
MTTIVRNGNNIEVMATFPDNSVDSIVTDPPYELGFMGKSWDSSGIAYNVALWQECLRVLKPGGHLLAFGGSRTYHRMACAIEDAGFQIRDQIMWVYGSGFPKSLNISKAIDKQAGAERQVVGSYETHDIRNAGLMDRKGSMVVAVTAPATPEAKQWDGWGTALKPAHEPIVLARKPFDGTVANNVLTYGTGALNIDESRVPSTDTMTSEGHFRKGNVVGDERTSVAAGQFGDGAWVAGTDLSKGRWPANVIHDGSDEVTELFPDTGKSTGGRIGKKSMGNITNVPAGQYEAGDPGYGDSGSASRFFYCAKAGKAERNAGLDKFEVKEMGRNQSSFAGGQILTGSGNIRSNSKLNHHPTVKPITLMRYLVRLVTPPNGVVLDPFAGSGSTLVAATLEGFSSIGIEITEEYIPIIEARIEWAKNNVNQQMTLEL